MTNKLYYGDNLEVLRDEKAFPDESVNLIYLDPPFNSNAGYNVLFKSASGAGADASIEAFDDTWTWGDASKNALPRIRCVPGIGFRQPCSAAKPSLIVIGAVGRA